jgi:hypothetical protein
LIRTCGAVQVDASQTSDVDLFVNVPATNDEDERTFFAQIARDPSKAAVADLTFLAENDYAQQRRLTDLLIGAGIAGRVSAFASWNTVANTVGTALPEAIAVLAGRKTGGYDPRMHATFTAMRYIDDVVFHTTVRPQLNTDLSAAGIRDHTYLEPETSLLTASQNRALLWPAALDLLPKIAPQFRDAGITITLPWNRTFETELDVRLAPRR